MALVKALVTHIEPGTMIYRNAEEEFEHGGKPYKHVEVVKLPEAAKPAKGKPIKDSEVGPE